MMANTESVQKLRIATYNIGDFGLLNTCYGSDEWVPIDNILVSKGIRIEEAGLIKADWMNDHRILWADVVIE